MNAAKISGSVLAALVLLGCGGSPPPETKPVPPEPPAKVTIPPPDAPAPAPALPPAEAKKMRRVKALVSGRVQGVGFRNFISVRAHALGLTGFVRNLKDGRVEAVVEGPDDKIDELIKALKTGPSGSRVDGVEVEEQTHRGEFGSFKIEL